ncbi:MAG: hypothetical protein PWR20_2513 [Bacteroidales bacterium]|nr:hypothetical protein [Bacteroidales bacterium]
MRKLFTFFTVIMLGILSQIHSQTTIAMQDFDGTNTLTYTPTGGTTYTDNSGTNDRPQEVPFYASSNTAYGVTNSTSHLVFSNVTGLQNYTNKYFEFRLASWSIGSTSNGADAADSVTIMVAIDGGTFSTELKVQGYNNAWWHYSTGTGEASVNYDGDNTPEIFQPIGGGERTTDGYSTIKVNLPNSCSSATLKVSMKNNSSKERWTIDDIKLIGTSSASNIITTGTVSTPPFCVNSINSASGTVDFSATGTYSSSTFTAYLSDASGSFASPTTIGTTTVNGTNPTGSINITIPAGTASGTGYKIRIDCNSPAVTGTESTAFEIINGAKNVSGQTATAGNTKATLAWTNPSGCYDEIMIVAKEGSAVTATPSGDGTAYTANLAFGLGTTFDGGYVVYKGTSSPQTVTNLTNGQTYYFTFFTRKGTDWSSGVTANATPAVMPELVEVILPQYIQGLNGTNTNRLPFAYRVTLQNLLPNTTYRYFNQVVISSDDATTNGAGNCIFANPGGFVRTTQPSLATSGNYEEFTTDASGSYTGWFILEPTGNQRFTPGNQVYMRIMLNDGAGGTSVATRLTTTNPVTVINFGTNNASTEGSGLYGNSYSPGKNFVFLYDNTMGTGRPLAGTFVEDDGSENTTVNSYVGFYDSQVNAQEGKWGTIIPNINNNGVQNIIFYDLIGAYPMYYVWDNDGTWGTVNTSNPTAGTTALVIPHNEADGMYISTNVNIQIASGETLTVGNLTTNQSLTISDGGSLIAGSSAGDVTLERSYTGNNQFHLISSPVNSPVIGNVISIDQYNTVWIREYNEPTGNWINKSTGDNLVTGRGYSFITTDPNAVGTFTGTLVNSDHYMTLSYQGTSGNLNYDGWNLLGNPFTSAIDRDLGNWDPTNVEPAVYVWNNGNYVSWNGGGTLTDGIIPLGQGFFMKATANNGTVTIPEAARVHSNQAFYKSSPVNTLRVDVSNAANSYTDALVIRYTEGATAQYDASFDARKLSGLADAPEIWCPGDVPTSLNSLPSIEANPEVWIAYKPAGNTQHTLTFSGLETFEYSAPVILTDMVTGSRTDLRTQPSYTFMASATDPENRFKLTFASVGIDEPQALQGVNAWYQEGAIRLAQLPSAPCQAELYSTDGKLLLSTRVMPTQNQIPVSLKSAVYILRLFDGNQVRNIKFIVK